jgi:hypothetical protein
MYMAAVFLGVLVFVNRAFAAPSYFIQEGKRLSGYTFVPQYAVRVFFQKNNRVHGADFLSKPWASNA